MLIVVLYTVFVGASAAEFSTVQISYENRPPQEFNSPL